MGSWVAKHQRHIKAVALQGLGLAAPVLQQPGGVAFIAVGAGHDQHLGRFDDLADQKEEGQKWISAPA